MATKKVGKGFAAIQDAAQGATNAPAATAPQAAPITYDDMKERQRALGPTGPDGPITQPAASQTATGDPGVVDDQVLNQPALEPEKHPVYDSQDGEDADTGHAHLMHDLGTSIQEMMAKDPETNKSMADLMEEFMGKGVDYEAESKRLRQMIEARKTPKGPNWLAAGVGSWAGGPEVAGKFQALQQAATGAETKKQSDLEGLQSDLLKEHVDDLRSRGKTKEALLLGLLQGQMRQKETETLVGGRKDVAELNAQNRSDLEERRLGAAEERVRMTINARQDVSDKDRTAQQVMHLYESLLRQSTKDITGAVTPLYKPDEAMNLAVNSILPKVKPGVQAVKTGEAPPSETPAAPTTTPSKQSKFAQWKASQAVKPAAR
jgi:hypothetical protein